MATGDSVELNFEAIGADKVIKELENYISAVEDLEKASDVYLKKLVGSLEDTGSLSATCL